MLYAIVHSLLASNWIKNKARQRFGASIDRWYRCFYNILALITIIPVLALIALLPDRTIYTIPMPWVIFTTLLQILAAILLILAIYQLDTGLILGLKQISTPEEDRKPKLVTTGLYRWVRHPIYSSFLVLIWLNPFMTINLLALYIGFTLYSFFGVYIEEKRLLSEFGDEFSRYRRSTPMLIPIPRKT